MPANNTKRSNRDQSVNESFNEIGGSLVRETRLCQGYGVAESVSG